MQKALNSGPQLTSEYLLSILSLCIFHCLGTHDMKENAVQEK